MCIYCMAHGVIQHARLQSHSLLHASIVCRFTSPPLLGQSIGGHSNATMACTALSSLYLDGGFLPGVGLASMALRSTAQHFGASAKEKLADPEARPPTYDHCSMRGLFQVRVTCAWGHGNSNRDQQTWIKAGCNEADARNNNMPNKLPCVGGFVLGLWSSHTPHSDHWQVSMGLCVKVSLPLCLQVSFPGLLVEITKRNR